MFRLTSHNHILLSQMVDSKASILITINSIILSLVVSVLIRKLEENVYLLYPTVILISVCLATMVFSILASRPNISSGKFTREDIKNKKTNLLFFGNFHAMKLEDYEWGMKEMMKDAEYLYGSLIKDIYYLGKSTRQEVPLSTDCLQHFYVRICPSDTVVYRGLPAIG